MESRREWHCAQTSLLLTWSSRVETTIGLSRPGGRARVECRVVASGTVAAPAARSDVHPVGVIGSVGEVEVLLLLAHVAPESILVPDLGGEAARGSGPTISMLWNHSFRRMSHVG